MRHDWVNTRIDSSVISPSGNVHASSQWVHLEPHTFVCPVQTNHPNGGGIYFDSAQTTLRRATPYGKWEYVPENDSGWVFRRFWGTRDWAVLDTIQPINIFGGLMAASTKNQYLGWECFSPKIYLFDLEGNVIDSLGISITINQNALRPFYKKRNGEFKFWYKYNGPVFEMLMETRYGPAVQFASGWIVRAYRPAVDPQALRDSLRAGRPGWYASIKNVEFVAGYKPGRGKQDLWSKHFLWVNQNWHYQLYNPLHQLVYEGAAPGPLRIVGRWQDEIIAYGRFDLAREGYWFYKYRLNVVE